MASPDFDTQLDDALTRLVQGAPIDALERDVPEAADLLAVAQRMQLLKPTPEPRLAPGRARFLREAAGLDRPRVINWIGRPALALAAIVLLVLAVSVMFVGAMPGFATPSLTPTYTATPTNASPSPVQRSYLAPVHAVSAPPHLPAAVPAPAPVSATRAIKSDIEMAILECWKL